MTWGMQILSGSTLLAICSLIHVACIAFGVPILQREGRLLPSGQSNWRVLILLGFVIVLVVFGHTVQVWLWSVVFYGVGAFPDFAASFYFATATYTTLGYGDMLLGEGLRIFGSFAAITGLLTFGISTALLMGVLVRILPAFSEDGGSSEP